MCDIDITELTTACEHISELPGEAAEIMRREGFVIDNLDDRWQKLAFTFYTMIASAGSRASTALDEIEDNDTEVNDEFISHNQE